MIEFELLHPEMTYDMLGFLPEFFSLHNPAPAAEQLNHNYQHGGGWSPMPNWRLSPNGLLTYPGDPPLEPLAKAQLRDETIFFYRHAWVAILQPNGDFEVSRVD